MLPAAVRLPGMFGAKEFHSRPGDDLNVGTSNNSLLVQQSIPKLLFQKNANKMPVVIVRSCTSRRFLEHIEYRSQRT